VENLQKTLKSAPLKKKFKLFSKKMLFDASENCIEKWLFSDPK